MSDESIVIKPCAEANVFEIQQKKAFKINLEKTTECLKKKYNVIVVTPHLAVVELKKNKKKKINIFRNGRLLVKNTDMDEAKKISEEVEKCFDVLR
ncbi:MAG: hypothetical protein KAI55_00290 [Candidatus Aenigmarchaeota archaeon]|nr:hypothetical protein [Candidatus Aenigmarchaeota archaeon]